MNRQPNESSNAKLTGSLRALLLGGALALASTQNSPAAPVSPLTGNSLETRIQKLRQQLHATPDANILTGNGPALDGADAMWWRNVWGNGGWRNVGWPNGWRNGWRNGGRWGNWRNW